METDENGDIMFIRKQISETHGEQTIYLCREGLLLYNKHNWYLIRQPKINGKKTMIWFHRELLNLQGGEIRDHRNGNGLDNRISNLRHATPSQNNYNTRLRSDNSSGIKGVSFHIRDQRWVARIQSEGHSYYKSSEDKEVVEAWVREKREELHGEFANHG